MKHEEKIRREVLPIPDKQHVGLTTFDAKDPDTKYPPIEPLRPPWMPITSSSPRSASRSRWRFNERFRNRN